MIVHADEPRDQRLRRSVNDRRPAGAIIVDALPIVAIFPRSITTV